MKETMAYSTERNKVSQLLKSDDYGRSYLVSLHILDRLLTASRNNGCGETHLLALSAVNGLYISHENNVYDESITLCGLYTTSDKYITSSKVVTCKKCLHIMRKCDIVI